MRQPRRRIADLSPEELLNRDMNRAEWGPKLSRKPIVRKWHSEWAKNDEANLATLARARVSTQFGGSRVRRCEKVSKRSGEQCKNPALKGEKVCRKHAKGAVIARLLQRRRDEGRPVDYAGRIARRNMRMLLQQNRIPYALLREPIFREVMQLVAPKWFGKPRTVLGQRVTRDDLRAAALLSREMVLAWMAYEATGDVLPWTKVVMKAREAGFTGVGV